MYLCLYDVGINFNLFNISTAFNWKHVHHTLSFSLICQVTPSASKCRKCHHFSSELTSISFSWPINSTKVYCTERMLELSAEPGATHSPARSYKAPAWWRPVWSDLLRSTSISSWPGLHCRGWCSETKPKPWRSSPLWPGLPSHRTHQRPRICAVGKEGPVSASHKCRIIILFTM